MQAETILQLKKISLPKQFAGGSMFVQKDSRVVKCISY